MLQTAHIREELFSRFPSISKAAPGFHPALSFFQREKCLVLPTKLHFVKRIKPIVYDKSLTIFLHILAFFVEPTLFSKKTARLSTLSTEFSTLLHKLSTIQVV